MHLGFGYINLLSRASQAKSNQPKYHCIGLYYKDFDYSKASLSALANDSLSQILPTTSFSTWMHIAEPEYDL